jgi:hypothetical protein
MFPSFQKRVVVITLGCIFWHAAGTLRKIDGNINALKYQEIRENNLWPVVLTRHFSDRTYRFQDDTAPVH